MRVWKAKLIPRKIDTRENSNSTKEVDFLDGSFPGKEERGKLPGDYSTFNIVCTIIRLKPLACSLTL